MFMRNKKKVRDKMKLKFKIMMFITTLILIIASSVFVYALLSEQKEIDEITFNLGKIDITLNGSLMEGPIYPGINIVEEEYLLTNNSSIEIDLRVTIEILVDGRNIAEDEYLEEELINLNGEVTSNTYTISNILPSTTNISIINSITLNGYKVKSDYSGKKVEIKISFAVKQTKHVEWDEIEWT